MENCRSEPKKQKPLKEVKCFNGGKKAERGSEKENILTVLSEEVYPNAILTLHNELGQIVVEKLTA